MEPYAIFRQESFVNTVQSGEHFYHSAFYDCDFSGADLSETVFDDCLFSERGAISRCSFDRANLRDARFINCQMALSTFQHTDCFGCCFEQCDLKGADMSRAQWVNEINQKSYFCSIIFRQCNLSYVNFERQLMEGCDLSSNRWQGANLFSASLQGSDLSNGEFSQDCWEQFNLQGCDLRGVDLEGLNPRQVQLDGVLIRDWQQQQLLETLGVIVCP